MATKRVLAIHDLCSFGRCSLTAAIPVISAMGFQVCPFPTALFSNNFTYGDFTFSDFSSKMTGFMDKWEKLGLSFDCVYSGFLADCNQIEIVREAIRRFVKANAFVVVDPAMGDDGKLYPTLNTDFVTSMRSLVKEADIITPNYTEACLLLNQPYDTTQLDDASLKAVCQKLAQKENQKVVITSVPADENQIKVASYDSATKVFSVRSTPRIPFATCGTGDLFTSVLTGAMLQGKTLSEAVELAMKFVSLAIQYTYDSGSDYREGVQVEPCLKHLF